jgi:hypothetical protein
VKNVRRKTTFWNPQQPSQARVLSVTVRAVKNKFQGGNRMFKVVCEGHILPGLYTLIDASWKQAELEEAGKCADVIPAE